MDVKAKLKKLINRIFSFLSNIATWVILYYAVIENVKGAQNVLFFLIGFYFFASVVACLVLLVIDERDEKFYKDAKKPNTYIHYFFMMSNFMQVMILIWNGFITSGISLTCLIIISEVVYKRMLTLYNKKIEAEARPILRHNTTGIFPEDWEKI